MSGAWTQARRDGLAVFGLCGRARRSQSTSVCVTTVSSAVVRWLWDRELITPCVPPDEETVNQYGWFRITRKGWDCFSHLFPETAHRACERPT